MSLIENKLKLLPDEPGCYLMKDKNGTIIYVGKAKNLKNRVKSYFMGAHNYKTTKLVSKIVDFEYIVTNSEKAALVLELNLIKKHRPYFNIKLKDGSTYPYLKLTNEKAPMLKVVRKVDDRKAKYFGPFPDSKAAYQTLSLLNRLYPLRKCARLPKKVCLYYHMQQCLGPCVYDIDPGVYQKISEEIRRFLNGDTSTILTSLQADLERASENLQFEKAGHIHELIKSIESVTIKQQVQFNDLKDRDIFAYYEKDGYISIQGFFMRSGKILERTFVVEPLYEEANDALVSFIHQYYQNNLLPKEILLPTGIDLEDFSDLECKVLIPQRGSKKKLVEMVINNAKKAHEQKFALANLQVENKQQALERLSEIVGVNVNTIEIFDNSHLQGDANVSGMVVYEYGESVKSRYRHYKLGKYVSDLHSMEEVIYRRYFKALQDNNWPDLVIVDGGYEQIKAAKRVLDSFEASVPVYGLAKNQKHQTNNLVNSDGEIIVINKREPLFFFLTQMQDEVHRFALSFHHKQRAKGLTKSVLDEIEGVGPSRKAQLYKRFKSQKNIQAASIEELSEVVPIKVAQAIYQKLHEDKEN